jgi:hypothetical protein
MNVKRINNEKHKLNIDLSEAQYFADVDRQIDLHDKLKRLEENPEKYFKDEFKDWWDSLDSHNETIQCPECNHIQVAKVMDTLPFAIHVHQCVQCVCFIGESEWIEKIINDCKNYNVPVFIKQLGTHLSKQLGLKDRHGGEILEWPKHLQIREFPNVR